MVKRIADGTLSSKLAKEVFEALWNGEGQDADAIIEARGLKQVSDVSAIEPIIEEVLAANQKSVEEFRRAAREVSREVMSADQDSPEPPRPTPAPRQIASGEEPRKESSDEGSG